MRSVMGRLKQGIAMLRRSILLAAALVGVPFWTASAAPAAPGVAQFDGTWSVSIVTDSGSCDRGYRYALHIANGRIFYDNPNFNVSGQVNARGQVQVTVGAGSQQAFGTGRLSRDYGTGTWVGRSPTEQCSGHWEAERRPAGGGY
jgi:hypothetical protein